MERQIFALAVLLLFSAADAAAQMMVNGPINVEVRDESTSSLIPGAVVVLESGSPLSRQVCGPTNTAYCYRRREQTTVDGRFADRWTLVWGWGGNGDGVCGIAAVVSAPGYHPQSACQPVWRDEQAANFSFALLPVASAKISGRVLESGRPLPQSASTTITIAGYRGGAVSAGADGSYEFMVVPGKTYTISAANPHYSFAAASFSVPVTSNTTVNFEAIPNRYPISGRAVLSDGAPAAGATVNLNGQTTTADANGNYSFGNAAIGYDEAFSLSASLPGHTLLPPDANGRAAGPTQISFFEAASQVHTWWNTFLGIENIVELINNSARDAYVYIELLNPAGAIVRGNRALELPANNQYDLPLNQLFDAVQMPRDSYGMVKIYSTLYHPEGRATLYKPGPQGLNDPEYAITAPFPGELFGRSYVPFSLSRISADELEPAAVANWLSIGNPAAEAKTFTVNLYSYFGELLSSTARTIPAFGRHDFEPVRQAQGVIPTGLIEVIPADENASYLALLTRFGQPTSSALNGYTFAAALALAQGHIGEFTVPVIHIPGALNFIEMSNTGDSDVNVQAAWYSYEGRYLGMRRHTLSGHQVLRESAGTPLPFGTSGSVIIDADVSGAIIAHSVVYHRDPASRDISAADFSVSSSYPGVHLRGSFNTFLGQQNLLRVINTSNMTRHISIATISEGRRSNAIPVILPAHGRFDININTQSELVAPGAQTYGIAEILGLDGPVFAEILRARYHVHGVVDFTYAVPLRETN